MSANTTKTNVILNKIILFIKSLMIKIIINLVTNLYYKNRFLNIKFNV